MPLALLRIVYESATSASASPLTLNPSSDGCCFGSGGPDCVPAHTAVRVVDSEKPEPPPELDAPLLRMVVKSDAPLRMVPEPFDEVPACEGYGALDLDEEAAGGACPRMLFDRSEVEAVPADRKSDLRFFTDFCRLATSSAWVSQAHTPPA